jgi:SEC-C motif/Protein of unknown function (DUF1186)/PBS lyase HEAT-like repeat
MLENSTNDMVRQDYADPVARLLTAGDAHIFDVIEWPNYPKQYALGNEHIPALIRMACDMALHTAGSDAPEIWAPVHAWRALAQLRAEEAIEPLLEFAKTDLDDDAVSEEFSTVFGMIGPAAISPIAAFLGDRSIAWMPASLASGGLTEVVRRHPECRDECVAILTRLLERAADMDPTANGFAISSLLDLAAIEAIDTIREAFRLNAVDISIAGDLEDVEIELGLRRRRLTSKPNYPFVSKQFVSGSHVIDDDGGVPAKVGRNEQCPCGSGKKYKKCCLE